MTDWMAPPASSNQIRDSVSLSGVVVRCLDNNRKIKHQNRVLFAANPTYKNVLQLSKKNKGLE